MFFISYLFSPRFCHRFVGYLEEEAVKTYTHCLEVSLKNSFRWSDKQQKFYSLPKRYKQIQRFELAKLSTSVIVDKTITKVRYKSDERLFEFDVHAMSFVIIITQVKEKKNVR